MIARGLFSKLKWLCLCLVFAGGPGGIETAGAETLSGAALITALRQGGCVLVMRHASSPRAAPDKSVVNADNVAGERQLDEAGRTTARGMGTAIKKLRLPIGTVLSSPTYRALQTVRLAGLGRAKAAPELGDGGQGMMADAASAQSDWLKRKVAEPPGSGSNILIVTHMPNIVGAFGQAAANIADGETLVFHGDGSGPATIVARVKIDEWPELAAKY